MSLSLNASLRTCKVDTAYANKVQSDRFLNPSLLVCPAWGGVDTTGRQVCPDSYNTKNAGCNSAEDRIYVENAVSRPQYMEFINLSANGIQGNIYGNTMPWNEVGQTNRELKQINNVTGNFGLQFQANTYPGCSYYPYENALEQESAAKSNRLTAATVAGSFPYQENFKNLSRNQAFNYPSQKFAQNQQDAHVQGALNNMFQSNQYRQFAGNA